MLYPRSTAKGTEKIRSGLLQQMDYRLVPGVLQLHIRIKIIPTISVDALVEI